MAPLGFASPARPAARLQVSFAAPPGGCAAPAGRWRHSASPRRRGLRRGCSLVRCSAWRLRSRRLAPLGFASPARPDTAEQHRPGHVGAVRADAVDPVVGQPGDDLRLVDRPHVDGQPGIVGRGHQLGRGRQVERMDGDVAGVRQPGQGGALERLSREQARPQPGFPTAEGVDRPLVERRHEDAVVIAQLVGHRPGQPALGVPVGVRGPVLDLDIDAQVTAGVDGLGEGRNVRWQLASLQPDQRAAVGQGERRGARPACRRPCAGCRARRRRPPSRRQRRTRPGCSPGRRPTRRGGR